MVYNDFLKSKLLTPDAKIVFIYLRMHSDNSTGRSFPSLNTLAKETGLSKRTVQRCLLELQDKGAVSIEHRSNDRGTQSNLYTIYDTAKLWNAKDVTEMQSIASGLKDAELVEYLRSRGYNVTKKEPASGTDQSSEASTSFDKLNMVLTTKNPTTDATDCQERYSMENVRELFDYAVLAKDKNCNTSDLDSVMDILYDTLNSTKPTIRVSGEDRPSMVVIGKLMKLTYEEILYSIQKFNERTDRIGNPRAYMLAILYTAREQMHLDINNQVQHDFYGWTNDTD
jgi:DNA-binding transcriptional regulator YhcF (GntR family)